MDEHSPDDTFWKLKEASKRLADSYGTSHILRRAITESQRYGVDAKYIYLQTRLSQINKKGMVFPDESCETLMHLRSIKQQLSEHLRTEFTEAIC